MSFGLMSLSALLAAVAVVISAHAVPLPAPARAGELSRVKSWTYQLQGIDVAVLAQSNADMLVIDYSRDGREANAFSAADVARLRMHADGGRRIVLAYLSIGEAEDYRFYWQSKWRRNPPSWLGAANRDWPGNYAVRYWAPRWHAIIFGSPESYLDRIMRAGFDGVYLDRVDAFQMPAHGTTEPERAGAMAGFVNTLAAYARAHHPGFIIVAQNGEELLANPRFATAIDGFAKEDLLFGVTGDDRRNATSTIRASLTAISQFRKSGKPVFLAEYLSDPAVIATARADAAVLDMPLFIGSRELTNAQSR